MDSSGSPNAVAGLARSADDDGRRVRNARDRELVRQVQAGAAWAFPELLGHYEPRHRQRVGKLIALGRCRRADEPDALNAAAFALWRAARRYRLPAEGQVDGCAFASFEWGVGRAALSNFVRRLKRQEKGLDRSATAEEVLADGRGAEEGDDPLRVLLVGEGKEGVARVLAELPEADRVFIRLHWQERLSERKLAVRLGISVKRVRTRKKALRRLLRERLRDWQP